MKDLLSFTLLAMSLFLSVGCGGGKPASTEAETKALYESDEYEKQMMGQMSGGGDAAKGDAAKKE